MKSEANNPTYFPAHTRGNLLSSQESPLTQEPANRKVSPMEQFGHGRAVHTYPTIRFWAGVCWYRAKIQSQLWSNRSYRSSGIGTFIPHTGNTHFSTR
jgi:hypothetical protein